MIIKTWNLSIKNTQIFIQWWSQCTGGLYVQASVYQIWTTRTTIEWNLKTSFLKRGSLKSSLTVPQMNANQSISGLVFTHWTDTDLWDVTMSMDIHSIISKQLSDKFLPRYRKKSMPA